MDLTNFKTNFRSFFIEGWTSYAMIAVGLLLLLAIVGLTSTWLIQYRAEQMTKSHELKEAPLTACFNIDAPSKVEFIKRQRDEIRLLGNQHRDNAIRYFSYFYTTYLTITIFGLLAAIALAVITKSGVNSSSPHVISVFLVSTAVVVLYQGSFEVLKQKSNIDLNANASLKYAVLLDQIDTYCTTGKVAMKDPNDVLLAALPKPVEDSKGQEAKPTEQSQSKIGPFFVEPDPDQFINFISWQMDHLRNFAISVDDSKVGSIDSKRFFY
jgi:hypothetical protein